MGSVCRRPASSRAKGLPHSGETDEIYRQWQILVLQYQVLGKAAHDARLVAAMRVHGIENILTYNGADFRRYEGIRILKPDQA
jgi:hypothetical protein